MYIHKLDYIYLLFAVSIKFALENATHVHVLQEAIVVGIIDVPWMNDTIGVFYSRRNCR